MRKRPGVVLTGKAREQAIAEHIAWLEGRMPSEIYAEARREDWSTPIGKFLQRHLDSIDRRPNKRARTFSDIARAQGRRPKVARRSFAP